MRPIWFSLLLLTCLRAPADTVTSERLLSTGSNIVLKQIVERLSDRRLRALVLDLVNGKEQRIYMAAEDAVERKRGLWYMRAGSYEASL